jgi:hypothetical protein
MPIGWSGREALIATNDRWGKKQDLTPSTAALRIIHHLGTGNFVRAGGMWRVGAG